MRVLIVEDNQIARIAYQGFLEAESFTVDFAETGEQAIEMAKQKYDAILMDINLPKINGIEATIKIREQKIYGNPIIIGITADNDKDRLQMCLNAGMNEVMTKPASAEKIVNVLKKYFKEYHLHAD